MGDNEINAMMKDLDKIYQELQEEKDCKFFIFYLNNIF